MKVISQSIIKNNNLREVYKCVQEENGISRAMIAKKLSLSKTTVSALTEELISGGFLDDHGKCNDRTGIGRNPSFLYVGNSKNYIAVALWKKNSVEMRLVDIGNNIVSEYIQCEIKCNDDFPEKTYECYGKLEKKIWNGQRIIGIAVIIPGLIDNERNAIISTPLQISWDEGRKIVGMVREKFSSRMICILNDTACLAYAEAVNLNLINTNFAFINFVVGIGAALYFQNKILGGATGASTQFGHICIERGGLPCYCGARGCLEAMVGEGVLPQRWGDIIRDDSGMLVGKKLNYEMLSDLAEKGNKEAKKALLDIADEFSMALVNMVEIVSVRQIIIGGRGVYLGQIFLEEVRENMKHMGFHYMLDHVNVSFTKSPVGAEYIGAALYFMSQYYDFSQSTESGVYLG